MMTVANTIDERISSVASRTTAAAGRRSASGLAWFSRRRRTTFSTSMIASSTSAPMAMAMPPSVIVLMLAPKARSARTAAASDSGIAVSVIAAARRLARNSSTTTITRMPPSRSAATTLSTATSMKSDCRKIRRSIWMPARQLASAACRAPGPAAPVTSMVLAPGCFCTPTITAGLPLRDPSPRLKRRAFAHVGEVRTSTERSPRSATTVSPISSGAAHPPDRFEHVLLRALGVDAGGRVLAGASAPRSAARSATRRSRAAPRDAAITWNCRSAPPIGVTCETPGTASSRRRTVVSAMVRSVSGSSVSDEIAKNRISPMIDDTGASTGRSTCGGSAPLTSDSFSDTSWRAMKMSVPQSNSTQTTAMPTAVAERTRRTPEAPLMALSIGKRDQRFHLLGRHAVAFGEDGHGRAPSGPGTRRPASAAPSRRRRPAAGPRAR